MYRVTILGDKNLPYVGFVTALLGAILPLVDTYCPDRMEDRVVSNQLPVHPDSESESF